MNKISDVPILLRREIEALAVVPLLKAFEKEFGKERTLAIARKVIAKHAKQSGRELAERYGGNTPEKLVEALGAFHMEGEFREVSQNSVSFYVNKCPYVDMYRKLGLQEYGSLLSCERDPSTFSGFNSRITLSRKQTIMDGDCCCDFVFHFTKENKTKDEKLS